MSTAFFALLTPNIQMCVKMNNKCVHLGRHLMAIDKNKTEKLIQDIDDVFDNFMFSLTPPARAFVKRSVMGPAIDEIKHLISESRPPVLFILGRSGHGKSSLVNALANKHVAEVGDVKPTTSSTVPYDISFPERYSSWQIVDSRGIFETTHPDGAVSENALQTVSTDIVKYKPDVIMHVVSATEVRNLAPDLRHFRRIYSELKEKTGMSVPILVVVNKADTLGNPREWPPETYSHKAALIRETLDYLADEALQVRDKKQIDLHTSLRGFITDDESYLGIIPTCALEGEFWNIETLSFFIGKHIPLNTLLDFYQAQNRKNFLRQISSHLIERFSKIAGGIGAAPIPIADIAVLTPLQLLMIMTIGGLSCREFDQETAREYMAAAGVNIGMALGMRSAAKYLLRLVPVGGWALSGTIASTATYALGKSAESYFFGGKLQSPDYFKKEIEEGK